MERERRLALILRAGTPRQLDYKVLRKEPFWRIKENLCLYLIERERVETWEALNAQRSFARQGYPVRGVVTEVVEKLELESRERVRHIGKTILPWMEWPEPVDVEESKKRELMGEASSLTRAWIAYFEPENLKDYDDHLNQAMANAQR